MDSLRKRKIKEIKPKTKLKSLATVAILSSALVGAVAIATNLTGALKIQNLSVNNIIAENSNNVSTSTSDNLSTPISSIPQNIENVQTASGNTFVAYLRSDGTVWTWGNNQYGQLGNGKIENVNTPEMNQVLGENGIGHLENIKQITAGAHFMGALTNDGRVLTWGYNGYGQLGDKTTKNSGTPVYVVDEFGEQIRDIKYISAGSSHMMALTNDGEVLSWGYNNYGQLGINNKDTKTFAVKVQRFVISEDGTETTTLENMNNIKQISCGTEFSLALTNDGDVYAWGRGDYGQIGNGAAASVSIAKKVAISDVAKIDAGGLQAIALKTDGTVWAWGMNRYGNLGIATASTTSSNAAYKKTSPVQVLVAAGTPLTNVVDISSLYETSYALTEEGVLYGWGRNALTSSSDTVSGQIGDNTVAHKTVATRVVRNAGDELRNIKVLADGQHTHTNIVADNDGYLYVCGYVKNGQLGTKQDNNLYQMRPVDETYLELSNNQEYLEVGNTINLNVSYHNGLSAIGKQKQATNISFRSSNENIATVDNNGNVTAIKRGYVTIVAENLDNGDIAQIQINVVNRGAVAIPMVHSGKTFSVMLKEDGTVWTTGNSAVGELGNGTTIIVAEPTQVKIDANTYLTDIVKVSAGAQHALALKKDGTVWAWGEGANGRLGTGNSTDMRYATQVKNPTGDGFLENVIDISAGYDFSIVLTKDKLVYGFGACGDNQFGINSTADRTLPIKMNNVYNVIQIQAGRDSSLILKGDGTVWGTGLNTSGQIADGTTSNRTELVPTINKDKNGSLKGIVRITFGGHHMIALKADKTAFTWGWNRDGQLGDNTATNKPAPIDLPGPKNTGIMENIEVAGAGQEATYIKTEEEQVYATGLNSNGELSINSKSTSKVFVRVKDETGNDLTGLGFLGIGRETTYGFVFEDGSVGITGVGTGGQRGDGSLVSSQIITKIKGGKIYTDKTYEIGIGAEEKINVYLKPDFNLNLNNEDKITTQNLTFESLNSEIATVESNGTVRGVTPGVTGIKIKDTVNELECTAYIIVGSRDLSDTSKVVSGENFVALLKQDGTVWTWGNNTYGQLGNGKAENVNEAEPTKVLGIGGTGYLDDIIDISAGQYFVVALRRNGEVVTWGRNEIGELGTTVDVATTPMNVRERSGNILVGAIKVTAGTVNGAALKADGTVWVWGSNANSQLGQGDKVNSTYAIPVLGVTGTEENLNNIKDIQAGNNFFIALTNDGKLYGFGKNNVGQLGIGATGDKNRVTLAKDVANIKKIAVGNDFVLALTTDGTVYSWGEGDAGRLGYGSTNDKSAPVQVKLDVNNFLTDIVDIGANYANGYALDSNGIVYSWGAGTDGALGNTTTTSTSYPVKIVRIYKEELEKDIGKLQSGSPTSHTNIMIKRNGSLIGNGRTTSGQLGYAVNMSRVEDILHTYLEITDRISYVKQGESKKLNVRVEANLNAYGDNITDVGNITWESTNPEVATVDDKGNVQAKKTGETRIIATDDKWGYVAQARVYVTSNTEKTITAPMVVQGTSFTAVLRADGTVWTTGLNTNGQLGLGDKAYRGDFERVKIDESTYLENVTRIAASQYHMLAVTKDGFVYAWGLGTSGQLGRGDKLSSDYAVRVKDKTGTKDLSNIIDVSAGTAHSLALAKDGTLYSWGEGDNYRLGTFNTTDQLLPVEVVRGYDIVEMSAGNLHTAILRGDGFALAFGNNTNRQTGINTEDNRQVVSEMKDAIEEKRMRDLVSVKTGATYTMVLTKEGKVYFTGINTSGQTSQGNVTSPLARLTSAKILNSENEIVELDSNIASISAENTYSVAITKQNEAYVCGTNSAGQLGLGDKATTQNIFVKIKSPDGEDTLKNIDYVANGQGNPYNLAAITNDGKIYTWGTGANGQLGNGEYFDKLLPTIAGDNEIQVESVYVDLKLGETYSINPKLKQGLNAYCYEQTCDNVEYSSNNERVATVSETGVITANANGSTIIKIKDLDNNIEKYIKVNVSEYRDYTTPDISSGLNFTIALKADGTVWSWGNGANGRLGTGNTKNQTEPVQVLAPDGKNKLTNVKQIAVGHDAASALLEDGTVVSWGVNSNGALGNNSTAHSAIPVYLQDVNGNKITDVVKIARGHLTTIALKKDGSVWVCGYNGYGQLGQGNTTEYHYAVRVKDETGKGYLEGALDVYGIIRSMYVIKNNGEVWGWGANADQQLGTGDKTEKKLPQKSLIDNVVKLAPCAYGTSALKADGTVWTWGWNGYGQLANGTTTSNGTPHQAQMKLDSTLDPILVENIIDLGSTGATYHILDKNHKVYGVGLNTNGQLGNMTATNSSYFTELKSKYGEAMPKNIVKLSTSMSRTDSSEDSSVEYYIRADGSIYGTGKNTSSQLFGQVTDNFKSAKEMNQSYMEIDRASYLKIGESKKLTVNVVENFNLFAKAPEVGKLTWSSSNADIASVDEFGNILALAEGQTTITAKDDKFGFVASGIVYVTRNTEHTITIPQVTQGLDFTVVLKADGTVWATGLNDVGQLGIGQSISTTAVLQQVKKADGTNLDNVVKISSGLKHTLALTKDGKVYAWGCGTSGQLGQGVNTNSNVAINVKNSLGTDDINSIIDISAGREHSTLLTKTGDVYQFGLNNYLQIGDNTSTNRNLPVKVKEIYNVIQVSAGQYFTAMLRGDGTVWTVGQNYYGEMGNNTATRGSGTTNQGLGIPRQAMNADLNAPLRGITQITTGGWHTAVLTEAKKVYAWGHNADGALGQNNVTVYFTKPMIVLDPTDVPDEGTTVITNPKGISNVKQIFASERITFVVTDTNEVYATGENTLNQLSQNNNTDLTKVNKLYDYTGEEYISNIISATESSANTNNTAIIKKDGTVWVAGKGDKGQVGDDYYISTPLYRRMGFAEIKVDVVNETLSIGESGKINVDIKDGFNVYENEGDALGKVKFSSQNPEVVSINELGEFTALKQGTSRITIKDEANALMKTALIKVTRDAEDEVLSEIYGKRHTVLLRTDGSVVTWGANEYGQLGVGHNGAVTGYVEPLDPNGVDKLTGIISVSRGENFTVAVKKDGTVLAWGINNGAQLGNGNGTNQSKPTFVLDEHGNKLTDIVKVASGTNFTLALRKDGTVWAWGNNKYGQLGNNTFKNSNVAVQVKDTSGKGYLRDIADISAGDINGAALTHTKEVYVWGYNYQGEVGDGSTSRASDGAGNSKGLPVKSKISDVEKIACNTRNVFAITSDGKLYGWGYNGYGQLAIGVASTDSKSGSYQRTVPTVAKLNATTELTDVVDVGASHYTTYALLKDGTLLAWGYNGDGVIGNNATSNSSYPTVLKDTYGAEFTKKISRLMNNNYSTTNYMICDDGKILGNGLQDGKRLLNTRTGKQLTPKELQSDFMELSSRVVTIKQGEKATLQAQVRENLSAFAGHIKLGNISYTSSNTDVALVSDAGEITAVGLGEATITARDTTNGYIAQAIVKVIQNNEKAVAVPDITQGQDFTVVLKADGTVWATGLNTSGQLGDGTTTNKTKPVQVKINSKEYLTGIVEISSGQNFTIALSKDGEVYAWGANNYGQLGNGTTSKSVYATKMLKPDADGPIGNVIGIDAGTCSSYLLMKDGTVYAVGLNTRGQLGIQNNANKTLLNKILEAENIVRVSAQHTGVAMQTGEGKLLTVGYNLEGELGHNATTNTASNDAGRSKNLLWSVVNSTRDGELQNIVKVEGGTHQFIAITEDGKAYAWGYNAYGQLGTGNKTNYAYPVTMKVGDASTDITDKVIDVGASYYITMIKLQDKDGKTKVYVTGLNDNSQFGNGTKNNSLFFIPVKDKDNVLDAEGLDILPSNPYGIHNAGYIDEAGNVWTVGTNANGQIGDDTLYTRPNIVQIGELALKTEEPIIELTVGEEKPVKVNIEDTFNVYIKDISLGAVEYKSLDESVVAVDNTGKLTAKGVGETLVKVKDTERNIEIGILVKVKKDQEDMKYSPMVVGGDNHSVALKGNGQVWAWGYNKFGQLGNNSTVTTEIPTQVLNSDGSGFLTDVKMIAAGSNHTLALKADGTVWAWGYNNVGQLGDNTQISRYMPVQVLGEAGNGYLQDIIYIAAGTNYSAAVNKNGEVWTWGNNANGQLGDGTVVNKYTPVRAKANLTGVISVACGNTHMIALKSDGTVYTWGYNQYGKLGDNTTTQRAIPVKMLETADTYVQNAIAVEANNNNSYVLKADGTVLSVGYGANGQLGNNETANRSLPVQVKSIDGQGNLNNIKAIKAGANTVYALTKSNTVVAWGINTNGQLGNDELTNRTLPVQVKDETGLNELNEILYIGAGANHALTVENDGYVQVWGANTQRQLSETNITQSKLPIYIETKIIATPSRARLKVGDTQNLTIEMSAFNLFKPAEDVARQVSYKSLNNAIATVSDTGVITAVSNGITRVIAKDSLSGKVTSVEVSVLEEGAIATPKIVSGNNHTVALKADGTVWTYGYNNVGQLGLGDTKTRYIPTKVNIDNVIDIACGSNHTVALKADGTVWTWGMNDKGQLAQGNTKNSTIPVQALGVGGAGTLQGVKKIGAGASQWTALLETGEVVACGRNEAGDLCDNTTTNRSTPVYVLNHTGVGHVNNVRDISSSSCAILILKEDGTVWAGGHNCQGQSGQGNTKSNYLIKQVKDSTGTGTLSNIVEFSVSSHILALDEDGTVWAWGYNNCGQIGNNSTTNALLPVKVKDETGSGFLSNIVKLEAGNQYSMAITADGEVYSWGYNKNGQLGNNTTATSKLPKKVLNEDGSGNFTDAMLISNLGEHTNIAKTDGTVWTVGYNANGELGDDTNISRKLVKSISNAKLDVNEKYLQFTSLGETKKIEVKLNKGFNLLMESAVASGNTFESFDTSVATVDNNGNVTSIGAGVTYIKIKNEDLGLVTTVKVVVPDREGITVAKVVGGTNHYVALKADGSVWTWGYNGNGQLGLGNTVNKLEPTDTGMKDVIDIAVGANFTAVLKKDRTVWVTGQNNYGQLGQNNTTGSSVFIQVKAENGIDNLTDIIEITANDYYMAVLKADGTVWTWGYNGYGQLGNNSKTNSKLPTKVRKVNNIMQISAGLNHLVMLDSDGTVWSVGRNANGQFGINNTKDSLLPVKMLNSKGNAEIKDIRKVSAKIETTYLLDSTGSVYGIGYNGYGELGDGTTTKRLLPIQVKDTSRKCFNRCKRYILKTIYCRNSKKRRKCIYSRI